MATAWKVAGGSKNLLIVNLNLGGWSFWRKRGLIFKDFLDYTIIWAFCSPFSNLNTHCGDFLWAAASQKLWSLIWFEYRWTNFLALVVSRRTSPQPNCMTWMVIWLIYSTDLQKASHSQYGEQAYGFRSRFRNTPTQSRRSGPLVYLEMCCVTWTIFAARNRALVLSYIGLASCRTGRLSRKGILPIGSPSNALLTMPRFTS